MELERSEMHVEFRWIKAHAGTKGNDLRIDWLRKLPQTVTPRNATENSPRATFQRRQKNSTKSYSKKNATRPKRREKNILSQHRTHIDIEN
jgi:hypothetical protein